VAKIYEFISVQLSMRFHQGPQRRPVSGDAHVIVSAVRQLSPDGHDTLADFRCAKIVIDECTVSFDETEALTLSVIVDLARLEWLIIARLLTGEVAIQKRLISATFPTCNRGERDFTSRMRVTEF
jgi:hypothetical protein